jgi:hypothetical protein
LALSASYNCAGPSSTSTATQAVMELWMQNQYFKLNLDEQVVARFREFDSVST